MNRNKMSPDGGLNSLLDKLMDRMAVATVTQLAEARKNTLRFLDENPVIQGFEGNLDGNTEMREFLYQFSAFCRKQIVALENQE